MAPASGRRVGRRRGHLSRPDHAEELPEGSPVIHHAEVDGIAISVLNAEFPTSTINKVDADTRGDVGFDAPNSKRFAFHGVDDFKSGQEMGKAVVEPRAEGWWRLQPGANNPRAA